jgi:predicted nuclease of predicted toxin-antitoxin system
LLDQNLSPRLVDRLWDVFPDVTHVSLVGLDRSPDAEGWAYARAHDRVIVTKDADFADMVVLRGFPPKVVWLRLGNCTVRELEDALRADRAAIAALSQDPTVEVLSLY